MFKTKKLLNFLPHAAETRGFFKVINVSIKSNVILNDFQSIFSCSHRFEMYNSTPFLKRLLC